MSERRQAYAFLTDIHGNNTALQAVLDDVERVERERSFAPALRVCLGDSFDGGPDPLAVFETLKALGCPQLRGNHEDYLIECSRHPEHEKFTRPLWKFVPWTVQQLGERLVSVEVNSIERWSSRSQPELVGVHASVNMNQRVPDFFAQQSKMSPQFVESFSETFSSHSCFYFNGHSHYLGRHVQPQTQAVWFNCGSVGYPFVEKLEIHPDAPLATWVWVEVDSGGVFKVVNRRVPYSSDELLRRYVDSGALQECAPFSFAIAAQSLFNEDVVYPFFQRVKKDALTPIEMAFVLQRELQQQGVFERINRLLQRAGLHEIRSF